MDPNAVEATLIEIIDAFATNFPSEQVADLRELVHAGESGIAVENLCTQLFEYDVVPDMRTFDQLSRVGSVLGVKSEYWKQLRPEK